MRKKLLSAVLSVSMVAALMTGCGSQASEGAAPAAEASAETEAAGDAAPAEDGAAAEVAEGVDMSADTGKVINIYCWNDEFRTRVEAIYDKVVETSEDGTVTTLSDGTEIHWIVNPNQDGVYQQKLDEALMNQATAADDDKVDIFLSEADYVYKYTDADADVAVPLTELGIDPETDLADQYSFTKVTASDQNGVQRGSTWQCCPGVLVYRRDIAKAVFGTDDPVEVGEKVKDWDTMKATAEELKAAGYYAFASYADTFRLYGNSIANPWVSPGETKVVVDPKIMEWVNSSKEWLDAGYFDKNVKGQWNDDWNKDMGSASKVFAFLFPAWGIDFTVSPNWDGEAGSWAVTNPPSSYNWGGSYVHACRGSDNLGHAKDIILAMTANEDNLIKISKDYSDFTNNQPAMQKAATDDSFASDFLGGQNPFTYFSPVAEGIQMAPLSAYDQGCVELIQSSFSDYFQGQVDFDKAKANFETAIMERYPDITEVEWPQN